MRKSWDVAVFLAITAATSALAAGLARSRVVSWLEAFSVVTGAMCVWLTVKESVWNFPISLVNVTACSVLYFGTGLYADGSLQIVYFVLTAVGWYLWVFGGEKRTELKISRVDANSHAVVMATATVLTFVLWSVLHAAKGSATFWDGLTTALSLGAQWLLNQKRLENWLWWIVADLIYVPLYVYKELYLMSLLYGVFLVMATMGYLQWRRSLLEQRARGLDVLTVGSAA